MKPEFRKIYFPQFKKGGVVFILVLLALIARSVVTGNYFGIGLSLFIFLLLVLSHSGVIIRRHSYISYYSFFGLKFNDVKYINEIVRISVVHRKYTIAGDKSGDLIKDYVVILRDEKNKTIEASVSGSYDEARQDALQIAKIFDIEVTDLVKK